MQPFSTHSGKVMPLDRVNVDTTRWCQAIPEGADPRRFRAHPLLRLALPAGEKPNPQFVLNFPCYQGASVLLTRANFGCGSSREHAPGRKGLRLPRNSLPSYADIFYNNCFKNGILPAELSEQQIEELFQRTEKEEGYSLTVDLPSQTVTDNHGLKYKFEIAPPAKRSS